jgi:hypothetical protein
MVKVFVSHKREDSHQAVALGERLRLNGLDFYLDVVDSVEVKDGPEMSDYIRVQMSECTQIIAIISPATQNSWWVPWEIGVATEKNFPIASYASQNISNPPTYLTKWPRLRTASDIDLYARESKALESKRRIARLTESLDTVMKREPNEVAEFHRSLKKSLGQ